MRTRRNDKSFNNNKICITESCNALLVVFCRGLGLPSPRQIDLCEGERPASREFERERYSFNASRSRQGRISTRLWSVRNSGVGYKEYIGTTNPLPFGGKLRNFQLQEIITPSPLEGEGWGVGYKTSTINPERRYLW